jgi:pimeloyl-ACP methyl ester carboxylesterase
MHHRSILTILATILVTFASAQTPATIPYGNNPDAGGYKRINGISMYYESYGTGKPLILLHGNGGSIKSQRGRIEYFKNYFRIIAIDSRAHGKSLDSTTKILTYTQMANDVKTLMDSLQVDSAYIWGQSDGGILGLLIAINYPKKVARLATFGANLFPGKTAIYDEIENMVVDTLKTTKDFNTRRLYTLLEYQPDIKEKELRTISCPVLIMSGDRDAIRLEHTIKIFDNIPNSNLFVMPGATHFGSYQKPDLFNMVLLDFLTKPFSKLSSVEVFTGKH